MSLPDIPYESLRQRHLQDMRARMPVLLERLRWPAERLAAWREARLREVVRYAQAHSAWHHRRLAAIDPDRLTEAALRHVPPMTKDDLMAHFDEIATDPRVTLEGVERHLGSLVSDAYLFGHYHVNASGGSTGRRGVNLHDWDGWAEGWAGFLRWLVRLRGADAVTPRRPIVAAGVAALDPTHMSSALPQTFSDPMTMQMHRFPVTLPFEHIVDGIGALQPDVLIGYSTMLHRLALAASSGALRISPRAIVSVSEPLLPEVRSALNAAWEAPVLNYWATTEAMTVAVSCGSGCGMHLSDDLLIVEPVAVDGCEVRPGVRAAKVYVTNLSNFTPLPLIRYEITDEVTVLEQTCKCGCPFRLIDDVQGRLDDAFRYEGGLSVHPHVFRSRLGRERHIVEYQVRQTTSGAGIDVHVTGSTDLDALRDALASDLRRLGVAQPRITITAVEHIERQRSGKLKRFIPLSAAMH